MRSMGERLGRISTNGRISNCNWGDDGSVLYMTCHHNLCRIRTRTRGCTYSDWRR